MPDPSTFIYKLACSIATAEGFFVSNSLPSRMFNPGDLRGAPWLPKPNLVNGFIQFDSVAQGVAGLVHQLALDIARGQSIQQLIYGYAPPSDGNNSENYLLETCRRMGIDPGKDLDTPLQNFLTPLEIIP